MKNVVISGGSSGVGLAIARDLSKDNRVILIGRNQHKLQLAKKELGRNVDYIVGDLSTTLGRKVVAEFILKKTVQVDILIHSAGIYPTNAQDNIDNNLLSHYYLTMALLNVLHRSRVLIVTGNPQAIQIAPICEQQLNDMMRAAWTVTHKTLLVQLLIDKLATQQSTVNSFFPGDVRSDLMPYTHSLGNTSVPVGEYLALDENLSDVTGRFFDEKGNIVSLNQGKYNQEAAINILSKYIPEINQS
ncbi:SDR family NAD(P)-dependent oxidoreductase [Leuconostoc palmae]|uniref:SDR family NAD(P)-dependent oxidoreductase n=1 Tax=Leuconostoc palmae TaxID=501487 RepID=UPI001C7D2AF1|nr:SDR family NAD(P)-dependent oxidoreductase [Leuconostoc palmae]